MANLGTSSLSPLGAFGAAEGGCSIVRQAVARCVRRGRGKLAVSHGHQPLRASWPRSAVPISSASRLRHAGPPLSRVHQTEL